MNTIQDRLSIFLESESLSKSQFADSINMARAGITHIMSGRNMPSYEFIVNVMEVYPFLDIEWLLTGRGSMYKDGHVPDNNDSGLFSAPPVPQPQIQPQIQPQPQPFKEDTQDTQDTQDSLETKPLQSVSTHTDISQNHRISRILVCFDDSAYQEFS